MILDEAIERYTSNAEYERTHGSLQGCLEFRQLAEWLKELKAYREQEPCEDAISRKVLISHIENQSREWGEDYDVQQILGDIEDMPPVKPQEPIDCANAEHDADGCLGYSTDRGGYSYCQTCLECPKASINNQDKEQEPCEDANANQHNSNALNDVGQHINALEVDAISRTELLKAIDTWDKFGCDADTKLVPYQDHYIPYIHYDDIIKCIKGMPSVKPQPTAHWIRGLSWKCSKCGYEDDRALGTDFCSHCGAKMN